MTLESFLNRDARKGTPSHRRSPKQEKEIAKKLGGSRIPGSGNGHQKGDVRVKGIIRIEAKTTKHKSFAITRDMVSKVEDASMVNGELPVIIVEFLDEQGRSEMEVVVMPRYALDSLVESQQ